MIGPNRSSIISPPLNITDDYEFQRIASHHGHAVEIVVYANGANVAIECTDCNEVVVDADRYPEE